jgi:hypothetical protein
MLNSFGSPTGLRVNLSTGIHYGQLRAGTDGRWPNGTQLIVETVLISPSWGVGLLISRCSMTTYAISQHQLCSFPLRY